MATAAFATTARAAEPADRAEEPSEATRTAWSLAGGVPMPTMGGTQFWADELFFHRWRIQRNVLTDHYRLLDGNNLRYASGTYDRCLARLDAVRAKRNLPPMRGKAVVLLHGLGGTRAEMARMAKHLEEEGGYAVFNVSYPSTRQGIGEHARSLAKVIDGLEGIEEIHFVGFSMGNIVIRHYLGDRTAGAAGRRPDPRLGRLVMIGPPNNGSVAATRLAHNRLVQTVLGEPGQQLGPEWVWLEENLATPPCEFGIVAGGLGNDEGFNPMLPGDDDGLVTVASTRLAGARDFAVVPTVHMLLPMDGKVMQYALCFLQNGYFLSADERRPVGDDDEG
jgi:pimeloyl-ACP methyl ester carboxylesterase